MSPSYSRSLLSLLLTVLIAGFSISDASPAAFLGREVAGAAGTVFGLPRGGGLFGGKDKAATATTDAAADKIADAAAATADMPKFPAMSKEEVEEWLDHIPVFAVTDSKGQGVVLKPDGETSVFFFFMSPLMANATLTQLKENASGAEDIDFRVSAFSLGKIWFKMIEADGETEVQLKLPNSDEEGTATKGVEYRLVPDTRDLLGARMLLTMNPEDGEKLKNGEEMAAEVAQAAIKKAMTEAPKFNSTYNEIPVFLIAQMRMQRKAEEGEDPSEAVTLTPMYFSLQNMVNTWQQFMAQAPDDVKGVEPSINLMGLHDIVEMMQKESPIDFRNVVLVPPTPVGEGGPGGAAGPADAMQAQVDSPMGGSTLGDL